jgi:hypothetical protein
MDGVELFNSPPIGIRVSLGRQRSLSDIDDEERSVEAAVLHLGQVHLRRQTLRVVAGGLKMVRIDVGVRVERDYPLVDRTRLGDQLRVVARRRLERRHHRAAETGEQRGNENCGKHAPAHEQ